MLPQVDLRDAIRVFLNLVLVSLLDIYLHSNHASLTYDERSKEV